MLNAKSSFSSINSPAELEERLLYGGSFKDAQHISEDGLNEFYNLLSRYGSDSSYVFAVKRPRKKKAAVNPEVEALRKDKEKQERALKRLQDLYLYSERAMTEKDFIIQKNEISSRIQDINTRLGMVTHDANSTLSDEDFVRQASHLLITKKLIGREYIYYKSLAQTVSPDVLKIYMETILDSVYVIDGRVSSIIFKNGLTHTFIDKK